MTDLRACRQQLNLTQAQLAELLGVPEVSLRFWDSGLRPTPRAVLESATAAAVQTTLNQQPMSLPNLAADLNVHVRTLQAAARTGRLEVHYSARSVYGRPHRLSTRAAVRVFLQTYYKRYWGQPTGRFAVPLIAPEDCGRRLRDLRTHLKFSQADLAEVVGAANKAVVYQWESGKRLPSPVFWERIVAPGRRCGAFR